MPVITSAAMLFSLLVAFVVTPWMTKRLLALSAKKQSSAKPDIETKKAQSEKPGLTDRVYRAVLQPMIDRPMLRLATLAVVVLLLVASIGLFYTRSVKVKMLPHDNKSEFQVIIDMDEGTTLERTAALTREIASELVKDPVVKNVQLYIGTAAPINFNGLVRHYFLRRGPNVADIQVSLTDKHVRSEKSHEIANRLRPIITRFGERYGAATLVAEVPPGPPVMSTMAVEVYGPNLDGQLEVAAKVKEVFEKEEGIVDIDWYVEDLQPEFSLKVDKAKAALSGVTTEQITNTIALSLYGKAAGLMHTDRDREPVEVLVKAPIGQRSSIDSLGDIKVHAMDGRLVAINELARTDLGSSDRFIYHKNLRRVVYITGEPTGEEESPVYGMLNTIDKMEKIDTPDKQQLTQLMTGMPEDEMSYSLKWDGEWKITYEVFRDMGIAFAIVLILMYTLVVAWFKSFITPLIIMTPIPLTLIGILPGHFITGTFFTATSMIGFIALAGIIVRNSILLVDFIEQEIESGLSLEEAVLNAGIVRFRPIFLTAAALVVGGSVILLDPIFSGLAVSLIFGVIIATALTLLVIPILYYSVRKFTQAHTAA